MVFMTLSIVPGTKWRLHQGEFLAIQKAAEETPALRLLTLSHQVVIVEKKINCPFKATFLQEKCTRKNASLRQKPWS